MRRFASVFILAALCGHAASAANGDVCTSTEMQAIKGGMMTPAWCYRIVDTTNSASGGPIAFNMMTQVSLKPGQVGMPLPDELSLRIAFNDCTAGTVTFTTGEVTGGTTESFPNVDGAAPSISLVAGGNARINLLKGQPYGTIINTSWTGVTGCTAGFRIMAIGYAEKRN